MFPRLAVFAGLVALAGCASSGPPDRVFPVYFTDYSAVLDGPAIQIVTRAAQIAKQFPREPVRVSGYADSLGSTQQEIAISKSRADAVANLLVQDGVNPSRITRDAVGTPPNSQPGVERRRVEIDIGT